MQPVFIAQIATIFKLRYSGNPAHFYYDRRTPSISVAKCDYFTHVLYIFTPNLCAPQKTISIQVMLFTIPPSLF